MRALERRHEHVHRHAEEEWIVLRAPGLVAGATRISQRPNHAAKVDHANIRFLRDLMSQYLCARPEAEEDRVNGKFLDRPEQVGFDQVEIFRIVPPVFADLVKPTAAGIGNECSCYLAIGWVGHQFPKKRRLRRGNQAPMMRQILAEPVPSPFEDNVRSLGATVAEQARIAGQVKF